MAFFHICLLKSHKKNPAKTCLAKFAELSFFFSVNFFKEFLRRKYFEYS